MMPPRESFHSHVADGYDVGLTSRPLRLSNLGRRMNVLRFQIPRDLRSRITYADKIDLWLEEYNIK